MTLSSGIGFTLSSDIRLTLSSDIGFILVEWIHWTDCLIAGNCKDLVGNQIFIVTEHSLLSKTLDIVKENYIVTEHFIVTKHYIALKHSIL